MTDERNASIKVLKKETLHRKFVSLEEYTIEHVTAKGERQVVEREIHDHGDAATILLYDPRARVTVLVEQLRLPVHLKGEDGWMIETPAGLLDGEHPEDAICREAMEETGFKVETARHLFDAYTSPGSVMEKVSFFAAEIDVNVRAGEGGGLGSESEDIKVLMIPIDEALGMIGKGRIRDAKTIMLLQWAALHYGIAWPQS